VSLHPELRDEVCAVAAELMSRIPVKGARTLAELDRLNELAGPLPIAVEACWRFAGGAGIASAVGRVLDDYEAHIARSHREIVGPLALPLDGGGSIDLPASTPADNLDPVVHPSQIRFVDHLRVRFKAPL